MQIPIFVNATKEMLITFSQLQNNRELIAGIFMYLYKFEDTKMYRMHI